MSCDSFACKLRRGEIGLSSDYDVLMTWFPPTNPNITGFTILRNNVKLGTVNKTITEFVDLNVSLEQIYTYKLQALNNGKVIEESKIINIIVPSYNFNSYNGEYYRAQPPINLGSIGVLNNGVPACKLIWTPVKYAVSYNIYRYDRKIGSTTNNFFIIPSEFTTVNGFTFTVTSVNTYNNESYPSSPTVRRMYRTDFETIPEGIVNTIKNIEKYSEVNNNKPRNIITWADNFDGQITTQYYNVYKDGVLKAEGLFARYYIDDEPTLGKLHSYEIHSIADYGDVSKSSVTGPITIQTISTTTLPEIGVINVKKVIPNDDSIKVIFDKYPGAKDYRVRILARSQETEMGVGGEHWSKYSGDNDLLQVNGVGPEITATMVIEAVDKRGPFVRMDGFDGPGHYIPEDVGEYSVIKPYSGDHDHDHSDGEGSAMGNYLSLDSMQMVNAEVNGQGDPSNIPNVIARSAPFTGTTVPFVLEGEQVFFENWRNVKPFSLVEASEELKQLRKYPGNYLWYFKIYENDKWQLFFDDVDTLHTQFFWMADHMMETVYDGGTIPIRNVPHVANGILIMKPKASANISGNKVLHATFEVDACLQGRRWIDMLIWDANEMLIDGRQPSNNITASNNTLRWTINNQFHLIDVTRMNEGIFEKTRISDSYNSSRNTYPYKSYLYTKHTDNNKYKIGEFTITKFTSDALGQIYSISSSYFAADGRFAPINTKFNIRILNKGATKSEWGDGENVNVNLENFNVKIYPNFSSKAPSYVNKNLGVILDEFNDARFGLITFEKKSVVNNQVRGNIYYKPGPEEDNLPPNKNEGWFDNRTRFDIYLSKNRVVILEDNYLVNDAELPYELPMDELQISFNHLVYHTALELNETRRSQSNRKYHPNYRPFMDERHWDNMGFAVVNDFPNFINPENTLDTY